VYATFKMVIKITTPNDRLPASAWSKSLYLAVGDQTHRHVFEFNKESSDGIWKYFEEAIYHWWYTTVLDYNTSNPSIKGQLVSSQKIYLV